MEQVAANQDRSQVTVKMQDKQQFFFKKGINHQGSFPKPRFIFTNFEIVSNSKDLLFYSAFVPKDHVA